MMLDRYRENAIFRSMESLAVPLATLQAAVEDAARTCVTAGVCKVEALMVQASKAKVKKTQKEIITAQFQDMAGSGDIDESMVHPALIAFGRNFLD